MSLSISQQDPPIIRADATGARLSVLVGIYQRLFDTISSAAIALGGGRPDIAIEPLLLARRLIVGLDGALDDGYEADLRDRLRYYYRFASDQLEDAGARQDTAPIKEVLRVLAPVRDALVDTVLRLGASAEKMD